jgi:hypothetical protein
VPKPSTPLVKMASSLHQLALAFCASFNDLDIADNLALRTPDCVHIFAPASLAFPLSMNNDQWGAHANGLKDILSHFPVTAKEIFASEGSNTVTIWATSDASFRKEVMDGDGGVEWTYNGEYMFVLQVEKEGKRIEKIVEFLDSTKVVEVRLLMERVRANLAKREEARK